MSTYDEYYTGFVSVADAVYHDATPEGFTLVSLPAGTPPGSSVDEAGFHAAAYRNEATGAIVIAYEGSSDRNPTYATATNDANTALALGVEPGAFAYADAFYKSVQALFPTDLIYVTGRGLGGAEAQYVAYNNAQVAGGMAFGSPGLPGYDGNGGQLTNMFEFFNVIDTRDVVGLYAIDFLSPYPAALTGYHYGSTVRIGPDVSPDLPADWQSLVPHFDDAVNWTENYAGPAGLLPMAKLEVFTSLYSAAEHGLMYTLSSDYLLCADVDVRSGDEGDHADIHYVSTDPMFGSLYVRGQLTTTFTQADIDAQAVTYLTPWQSAIDNITLTATDPYGQSAIINFSIVTIPSENDVPGPWVVTNTTLSVATGGQTELAGALATVDYNTLPQNMIYTVLTGPTHGQLFSQGRPVTSFSQADIDKHLVTYRENGDAADSDSFTFTATRVGDVVSDTQTFNIDIAPPTVGQPAPPLTPWAIGEVLDGVVQEGVTLSGAKVQSLIRQFIAGRGAVRSYEAEGNTYFYNRAEYDPGGAGALVSGLHSATFVFEDGKQTTLIGTAAELPRLFH